jgi:hypothetical protein
MIGLAKNMGGRAIFLWLQSAAMEPGTLRGRATRGVADFLGMRAFEEGRSQKLNDASFDIFQKPLEDLNQLERNQLENNSDFGNELLLLDEQRAASGDTFADYRFERNLVHQLELVKSQEAFDDMLFALRGGSGGKTVTENGKKTKLPGVWSVTGDFSERIGDNKAATSTDLQRFRVENNMSGYTGRDPTNEFDAMLEGWYDLLDEHTDTFVITKPSGKTIERQGDLDFDTWLPAAEAFIAALSPELQRQLQQWRDRKEAAPAVNEIIALRGPIVDPNTGKIVLKDDGTPKFRTDKELWKGVLDILKQELGIGERELLFIWAEGATSSTGLTTPAAPAPALAPAPIPQATPGSGYLWELQPPPPK